jgi:hypothetical protein
MNKEIIKTLTSKKITRQNFFFIVFSSINPANSDFLHINIVGSPARIFLPHFEKESQLLILALRKRNFKRAGTETRPYAL